VVREIAPGMKANLWGYNGQSPGPTIEVVEGDRVRIFVTNKLPEQPRCTGTASACPMAWMAYPA
jgi:FtsP/CotA-like multicopper oxidase with cupredoxin domain